MNISYNNLRNAMESKGYVFFDNGFYNVNIFGIRSNNQTVNEFNDFFGIAYRDEFNNTNLNLFRATTKPGLYWLKNKVGNVNGTAILIPGQYRKCWKLGYHNSYQALVQNGMNIFNVWRDNDSDGELDINGKIYKDVSGLNGHTTSFKNDVDKVGAYSSGCQVVQDVLDFKLFLSIIIKSANNYSNVFSYTLMEQDDI